MLLCHQKKNPSPNQECHGNAVADGPPLSDDETDAIPTFDLRRGYQLAVDCLVRCDEVIGSQRERLSSKDERIAGLEAQITGLEARIVRMSLELADSRAREDELRLRSRRTATGVSDGDAPRRKTGEEETERAGRAPKLTAAGPGRETGRRARRPLSRSWSGKGRPEEIPTMDGRSSSARELGQLGGYFASGDPSAPVGLSALGQIFMRPKMNDAAQITTSAKDATKTARDDQQRGRIFNQVHF